jgi:uncharacterized membrane protein YhaH (DUF805 family)
MHWYLDVLKKYATFDGRARRTEYWMFFLISFIISSICGIIDVYVIQRPNTLGALYSLAVFLPTLAVGARRLHDIGKSAWWLLLYFAICIGWIILLVWFATDSQPGSNQYGPNPKRPFSSDGPKPLDLPGAEI